MFPGEEISGRKIIRAKRDSKFLQKKHWANCLMKKKLGEELSGEKKFGRRIIRSVLKTSSEEISSEEIS
jgi:hypothetical protein